MPVRAVNKIAPFWFSPRVVCVPCQGNGKVPGDAALCAACNGEGRVADPAPEPKARFKLRPLTQLQRMEIGEQFNSPAPDRITRAKEAVLRYGLMGWEHFYDDEGAVAFLDMTSNLARLDMATINDLFDAINAASRLEEPERKN